MAKRQKSSQGGVNGGQSLDADARVLTRSGTEPLSPVGVGVTGLPEAKYRVSGVVAAGRTESGSGNDGHIPATSPYLHLRLEVVTCRRALCPAAPDPSPLSDFLQKHPAPGAAMAGMHSAGKGPENTNEMAE